MPLHLLKGIDYDTIALYVRSEKRLPVSVSSDRPISRYCLPLPICVGPKLTADHSIFPSKKGLILIEHFVIAYNSP
jgi:hypothetical protein